MAPTLGGDNNITPFDQSTYGNLVAIDDNREGAQRVPFGMNVTYGNPGVVIKAYEAAADYVYVDGDYRAAYNPDPDSGAINPATELTRQVVFLRPNYVIVYDRVATRKETYAKQLRWHFLSAPTVTGNAFVEKRGQSKLFGQTFSTVPLSTTMSTVFVPTSNTPVPISRLITKNTVQTASVRYVTAFQVADASKVAADPMLHVQSSDKRLEGVQVGDQMVLFGRDGAVDLGTPTTYQVSASGIVQNLITNLTPGVAYQVTVDGGPPVTVTSTSQGTLRFTIKSGGPSSVTVSRAV